MHRYLSNLLNEFKKKACPHLNQSGIHSPNPGVKKKYLK